MPQLGPDEVRHLASLARIAISETEASRLAGELGAIMTAVAKIGEVVTPEVPRTSHPVPLTGGTRADEVGPERLTSEQALSGAPQVDSGRFVVSAILGEEQ